MSRHVLIVEDDPDIALMMSLSLGIAGNTVATVGSGQAALDELAQSRPDVMVLDLGLPGMGGEEVLRLVRADVGLQGLRILVASATAQREPGDLACDGYLTKPFDPRELVRAVQDLVEPSAPKPY